jgi:hypothetical protein
MIPDLMISQSSSCNVLALDNICQFRTHKILHGKGSCWYPVPVQTRFEIEARSTRGASPFRFDTAREEEARPKFRPAWPRSKCKKFDFGAPAFCNVLSIYQNVSWLLQTTLSCRNYEVPRYAGLLYEPGLKEAIYELYTNYRYRQIQCPGV